MGAPCSARARSTISMARLTPAQKPRGLASSKSISSSPIYGHFPQAVTGGDSDRFSAQQNCFALVNAEEYSAAEVTGEQPACSSRATARYANVRTDFSRSHCRVFAAAINASLSFASTTVSYTHLRAHETRHELVCRLLLEKKKN